MERVLARYWRSILRINKFDESFKQHIDRLNCLNLDDKLETTNPKNSILPKETQRQINSLSKGKALWPNFLKY